MITSMLLLLGSSLSSLLVTLLMMESNWWKLNVPTNSWKKLKWSFDSNIEESEPWILWPYRTGSPWRSCQECPGAETRAPRTSRWGSPIIKISSRMLKMFLMKASQKEYYLKFWSPAAWRRSLRTWRVDQPRDSRSQYFASYTKFFFSIFMH